MEEKDILKRLIKSDPLFNMIHVVNQKYDILPDDKEHLGAYIEYQDICELREDFLEELSDCIVSWIYSSEKYNELRSIAIANGKDERGASHEVCRKARNKFRGLHAKDNLLIQGQLGELLLFTFIQRYMQAVPLLRKMPITTSSEHERFGADAIHYKIDNGKNIIVLGEAKTYTSNYRFKTAFEDALTSILSTYKNHRAELHSYVHEDFLDKEMDKVAEEYLCNKLKNVEVHLVSIITYNETKTLTINSENEIKKQIENIIADKYKSFDNSKIDIKKNPILKRITYIVFPVWDLKDLAMKFQKLI